MVKVKEDLTGMKFNRLTVKEQAEDYIDNNKIHYSQWLCICDCGNNVIVRGNGLKNGHTKSCGCLQREYTSKISKRQNKYDLSGEYGIGYTTKGEEFYFDLEDYDKIKDYCWCIDKKGYVISSYNIKTKNRAIVAMHQLIINCKGVDHIHGKDSRNDNRKINIRVATKSQNAMNIGLRSNNTSGITGVYFNKKMNKWVASIMVDGIRLRLGSFDIDKKHEAEKIRKEAEEKYFGEYSYDNSMNVGENSAEIII